MYEFEQSKKNNLILYGITTRHPETSESLRNRVSQIFRDNLNIKRDLPVLRATRVQTGPEVRGCRPVLVTFETFKDRETVLRLAKVLKKANVIVTEDLSKRTRESRQELRKFMRQVNLQCGNFIIFLSLRFQVKLTFSGSRSEKSAILTHLEALNLDFLKFCTFLRFKSTQLTRFRAP